MVCPRFSLGLIALSAIGLLVALAAPVGATDEFFYYPLRAGESLSDVSRIFRVPVQELIDLNEITDPNRMALGQMLKVPNGFARDAAALKTERDGLLQEKQRIERESLGHQRTVTALQEQVRQLESEKEALAREVTSLIHLQTWTKVLVGLLAVALLWALKSQAQRVLAARRLRAAIAERAALTMAKEKYRDAAAQLELRYQKLYRGQGEAPREVIADGIFRLTRAFREGAAEMERLLEMLQAERARDERFRDVGRKMLSRRARDAPENREGAA